MCGGRHITCMDIPRHWRLNRQRYGLVNSKNNTAAKEGLHDNPMLTLAQLLMLSREDQEVAHENMLEGSYSEIRSGARSYGRERA